MCHQHRKLNGKGRKQHQQHAQSTRGAAGQEEEEVNCRDDLGKNTLACITRTHANAHNTPTLSAELDELSVIGSP